MYLCSFFLCLIQMYETSCCLFFAPTKNINKTLFNKCNHILLFSLVHLLFILLTFSCTLQSFSFSSFIVSKMLLNLVSLSSWLFFFIFSRDASSLVHRVFVILQQSFFPLLLFTSSFHEVLHTNEAFSKNKEAQRTVRNFMPASASNTFAFLFTAILLLVYISVKKKSSVFPPLNAYTNHFLLSPFLSIFSFCRIVLNVPTDAHPLEKQSHLDTDRSTQICNSLTLIF